MGVLRGRGGRGRAVAPLGGIHIEPDDFVGRRIGHRVGLDAVARARSYFEGQAPARRD